MAETILGAFVEDLKQAEAREAQLHRQIICAWGELTLKAARSKSADEARGLYYAAELLEQMMHTRSAEPLRLSRERSMSIAGLR